MKRARLITVFMWCASAADDQVLNERGLKVIDERRFETARLSSQTLLNAYPTSPLRDVARAAIRASWVRQGVADPDPLMLFQEGQTGMAAGKREAALLAWQTLVNLYPRSAEAARAREAIAAATSAARMRRTGRGFPPASRA